MHSAFQALLAGASHRNVWRLYDLRFSATSLGVSKRMCLQSFPSLATSAIRWLLCVVVPSDSSFRKLRAGHVTLISWMLRFPARFSNPVSSGFILRGGVRLGWD